MSGSLTHSPAQIISQLLIDLGVGTDPADSGSWPIFYSGEPDSPDSLIAVIDSGGRQEGWTQVDGEQQEQHGAQILVRSPGHSAGYLKARALAITLEGTVYQNSVTIGAVTYSIHSILRKGDVLVLGKGHPTDNLNRFTINALATLKQSS